MSEIEDFKAKGNLNYKAPYTFVPIGKPLASPTKDLGLSRPVEGALSGALNLSWTAETEMLVGGGEAIGDEQENGLPFKIDGKYAIAGSTIKGLIRSVMEIACFARVSFVDNYAPYVRSFQDKTWKKMVKPDPNAKAPNGGWLFRTKDGFELLPAVVEKYAFEKFLPNLGLTRPNWHEMDLHARLTALEKRKLTGLKPTSVFDETTTVQGFAQLVVSGPMAEPGRKGPKEKRSEHLFHWPEDLSTVSIDPKTAEHFLASLNKDASGKDRPEANLSTWITTGGVAHFSPDQKNKYVPLEQQLANPARYALPVFWRNPYGGRQNKCNSQPILSLTAFYRVPTGRMLSEIVEDMNNHICEESSERAKKLDLVQALLGWAPPETPKGRIKERLKAEKSLRSRVMFGFGFSENAKPLRKRKWAATKPQASYWPFYLAPETCDAKHPVDYSNPNAILAGRKRYPARDAANPNLPEVSPEQDSTVTFLEKGAVFTSEIRFRNITPIELGALVWAITFGDISENEDRGLRHMVGRAKSHGHGQMRVAITGSSIRSVQNGTAPTLEEAIESYKNWITQETSETFDDHPTIRTLLGTAHAATGAEVSEYLVFAGGKGDAILKEYSAIKERAQKHNGDYSGKKVSEVGEIGLPRYPGYPRKEGN